MSFELIRRFRLIFWDFDGVIKDSVAVKTKAFIQLFESYGSDVAERVKLHHEANGGMSRFEKIPIYLKYAGEMATPNQIHKYCQQFAGLVRQGVVDAPWVSGAETLLRNNPLGQVFVLVSATPQEEIEGILTDLNLRICFAEVYGAPTSKRDAIRTTLSAHGLFAHQCLMIGDAKTDLDAAADNNIQFLLRRHSSNGKVFEQYTGNSVEDFTNL